MIRRTGWHKLSTTSVLNVLKTPRILFVIVFFITILQRPTPHTEALAIRPNEDEQNDGQLHKESCQFSGYTRTCLMDSTREASAVNFRVRPTTSASIFTCRESSDCFDTLCGGLLPGPQPFSSKV